MKSFVIRVRTLCGGGWASCDRRCRSCRCGSGRSCGCGSGRCSCSSCLRGLLGVVGSPFRRVVTLTASSPLLSVVVGAICTARGIRTVPSTVPRASITIASSSTTAAPTVGIIPTRHDALRGLFQNDALYHLLDLCTSFCGSDNSCNAGALARCRKGWNLNFCLCLVLHLPNDAPGATNAHSNILIWNLHLNGYMRNLIALGSKYILNQLLGKICTLRSGVGDTDGPHCRIGRISRLRDLNVGSAPVLNPLDGSTSLPNNETDICIGNFDSH
mmetsp:Transcript_6716/g.11727  ORF Transcript_6716/g.11727 Transcript_6716/m.11727 type:complete len:272 (-) Transcript_6716:136-951(-)